MTRADTPEPRGLSERLGASLFATVLVLSFGFGQKALSKAKAQQSKLERQSQGMDDLEHPHQGPDRIFKL